MTTTYKPVSMLFERWEMMGLPALPFGDPPGPLLKPAPASEGAGREVADGGLAQYRRLKQTYSDYLLLFRLGDFYETFYEDAKTASRLLGLALTTRHTGNDDVALAGFPANPPHIAEAYIGKLILAGQRVAVCERDDVSRLVVPGDPPGEMDPRQPTEPTEAPKPRPLAWSHLAKGRKAMLAELEKHLRQEGWPYVVVDEAKKSIFANVAIKSFDFLIYREREANLLALVVTGKPRPEQVERMIEWQRIFGKDFEAVFVFQVAGLWWLVSLKNLQTKNPLAQAIQLGQHMGLEPGEPQ